jgi:hypothetical protein
MSSPVRLPVDQDLSAREKAKRFDLLRSAAAGLENILVRLQGEYAYNLTARSSSAQRSQVAQ